MPNISVCNLSISFKSWSFGNYKLILLLKIWKTRTYFEILTVFRFVILSSSTAVLPRWWWRWCRWCVVNMLHLLRLLLLLLVLLLVLSLRCQLLLLLSLLYSLHSIEHGSWVTGHVLFVVNIKIGFQFEIAIEASHQSWSPTHKLAMAASCT